jgi:hypothetical protein
VATRGAGNPRSPGGRQLCRWRRRSLLHVSYAIMAKCYARGRLTGRRDFVFSDIGEENSIHLLPLLGFGQVLARSLLAGSKPLLLILIETIKGLRLANFAWHQRSGVRLQVLLDVERLAATMARELRQSMLAIQVLPIDALEGFEQNYHGLVTRVS